jgi:hypothetical protein
VAGALIAAAATLAAIQPASALLVADGSFTMVPVIGAGSVTVDTGVIKSTTSSKTDPPLVVQAVTSNLDLAIAPGNAVTASSLTWPVPPDIGKSVAVDITLTVGGIEFKFFTGITDSRVALDVAMNTAGSFSEQFSGTLSDGAGIFLTGAAVTLSEACTQSVVRGRPGLISCTNSVITIGIPAPPAARVKFRNPPRWRSWGHHCSVSACFGVAAT